MNRFWVAAVPLTIFGAFALAVRAVFVTPPPEQPWLWLTGSVLLLFLTKLGRDHSRRERPDRASSA